MLWENIKNIFNLKINGAPSNNTAPANSSDKIFKNFMIEINSTAQYYSRKYGSLTKPTNLLMNEVRNE